MAAESGDTKQWSLPAHSGGVAHSGGAAHQSRYQAARGEGGQSEFGDRRWSVSTHDQVSLADFQLHGEECKKKLDTREGSSQSVKTIENAGIVCYMVSPCGNIFLVLGKDSDLKYRHEQHNIPRYRWSETGGRLHDGECAARGAARECFEEVCAVEGATPLACAKENNDHGATADKKIASIERMLVDKKYSFKTMLVTTTSEGGQPTSRTFNTTFVCEVPWNPDVTRQHREAFHCLLPMYEQCEKLHRTIASMKSPFSALWNLRSWTCGQLRNWLKENKLLHRVSGGGGDGGCGSDHKQGPARYLNGGGVGGAMADVAQQNSFSVLIDEDDRTSELATPTLPRAFSKDGPMHVVRITTTTTQADQKSGTVRVEFAHAAPTRDSWNAQLFPCDDVLALSIFVDDPHVLHELSNICKMEQHMRHIYRTLPNSMRAHPAIQFSDQTYLFSVQADYLEKKSLQLWHINRLVGVVHDGHFRSSEVQAKREWFRTSFLPTLSAILLQFRGTRQ